MGESRKHHYLSQFYFRNCAKNWKHVFQIENRSSSAYLVAVDDAAGIRDYHALDCDGCPDPSALEKRLSASAGRWAAALAGVLAGNPLTGERKVALVEFVSVMRMRVPAMKSGVEAFEAGMIGEFAKRLEREGKLPPFSEVFGRRLTIDDLAIRIQNWKLLETMFNLAIDPAHQGVLGGMTLTLLDAPEGTHFLTCDQPVALYHPDAKATDTYGVGPATEGCELSMPLSWNATALLTHDPKAPANRTLSHAEVEEFNRRTIIMAFSYVFAPETSEPDKEAVGRHARFTAGIAFDVAVTGRGSRHLLRTRPVMPSSNYARVAADIQ